MQAVVVGFGSIGSLHANVLKSLGLQVHVVSKRDIDFPDYGDSLASALELNPEYVVIASKTSEHEASLSKLKELGYSGRVLVEKPIFQDYPSPVPSYPFEVFVGYNLRFHPVIDEFKRQVQSEEIYSVHAYVGQILSSWRQGRDVKSVYSARKSEGGGVLRDLSHELDLMLHLFGESKQFKALGGRVADLTVDSDDVYGFLIETEKCPVISMQINYLDRVSRREIIVNTSQTSYKMDIVNKVIESGNEKKSFTVAREDTYTAMHKSILAGDDERACTFMQALQTQKLIELADKQNTGMSSVGC